MPIIQLILVLVLVGLALWAINRFVPMDATINKILNFVVIVALVLWLLNVFGIFALLGGLGTVPHLRN